MSIPGLLPAREPAVLALADGSIFPGVAIGALGETTGEVVFNTAMTGYQEILTDPSYAEQIVTLTYPHIGNVGINAEDAESNKIWAKGLIIRELSMLVSNWRSQESLADYLKRQNIIAIANVDTRRLTRILRDRGAQHGCIMTGGADPRTAIKKAQAYPGLQGVDLAKVVSTKKAYTWQQGTLNLEVLSETTHSQTSSTNPAFKVVVYDFGVKHQILKLLKDQGCEVFVVPATTPASKVLQMKPDGVLLSNGPGDPAACDYAIENIRTLMENNIPLFGICLGFQLLALACGAKTFKMKFGHHGANHPVFNCNDESVFITSQNHGFAVEEQSLPTCLQITHRSLFDGTLQGIVHTTKPAFAFQGHPEASPGPHDICCLFTTFIDLMQHGSGDNSDKENREKETSSQIKSKNRLGVQ